VKIPTWATWDEVRHVDWQLRDLAPRPEKTTHLGMVRMVYAYAMSMPSIYGDLM